MRAFERLALSRSAPFLAVLAGVAGARVGLLLENRWALPVLQAIPAFPLFLGGVLARRTGRTIFLMLLWTVATSFPVILAANADPLGVEPLVIRGKEYRDEMFAWIRTGVGPESDPSTFLPRHALHFGAFSLLAFATAGGAGLLFGAVLLNYMNFYVGALLAEAALPARIAPFAWPIYAVVRVAGYVVCATALARLLLYRREVSDRRAALGTLAFGFALVVTDALLKAALAPGYRERLLVGL